MYHKQLHIHFVGIGGIGMSGIATILRYQGYVVSGCDNDCDQTTVRSLRELGCQIYPGNNNEFCQQAPIDIIVYSSDIRADHEELIAAQKKGIPTIKRALMLAELMRTKYSIAIAGAHGKTTTTSLISHILIEAKLDPTVIIGGILKTISTNARFGTGDFLVAEADESDRTILNLHATLAVVTNIDYEHVDTYKDIDDIKQTFKQFLNNLPFYGKAIVCIDDPHIRSLMPMPHIKTITYGFDENADVRASEIELFPQHSLCSISTKKNGVLNKQVKIAMPGRHNIHNALAAIALTHEIGISFDIIAEALENFGGVERRFSFKGLFKNAEIFDDYGHHPEEIRNTLIVARNRTKNKLTVVFQPHRFTRTEKLWDLFINTLHASPIDRLIITDIYPASEKPIANITSAHLAKDLQARNPNFPVSYLPIDADFDAIKKELDHVTQAGDLILLLGAGKINKIADTLI
jgi:UDP-N-acetylmuramate--alanine ligase